MIAKLSGILDSRSDNSVILNVGGVGYAVFCSLQTLDALPSIGEDTTLLIETVVREDFIHLYGFFTAAERDCFRLLVTVQGVGMRVAQAILSTLAPNELLAAIAQQNKTLITQADGVGPKLATRIVIELKDKVSSLSHTMASPMLASTSLSSTHYDDALSALINLGYRPQEATQALQRTLQETNDQGAPVAELIRLSLARLAKGTAA